MKVAFLHARQDDKCARWMLASLEQAMPAAQPVQLTDMETPAIAGCEVIRLPWEHPNPMIFRMEHLAQLDGEALVIDTDVVVQTDLAPVFAFDFDVGLTWRDGPLYDPAGNDLAKMMPYNCGVMWHRERAFWRTCLRWCAGKSLDWYADQLAVAQVAPRFNVLKLHCDNFNYKPRRGEDVSRRLAVHYKGNARELMVERFA